MKLKRKITESEFNALDETKKSLYVKDGENYILDIEDAAFENLKAEKKAAEEKLQEYEREEAERIRKAEERAEKKAKEEYEKAKGDKDVEAVEKSWTEKYEKLQNEKNESDKKYQEYVKKSLIDNAVTTMANKISTSPTLLVPHIRNRLDVDLSTDTPKIIVLDENGQRSALTLAELEKAFVDNKEFSAIIKVNTANGGAKSGNSVNPNGGANGEVSFNNMSDQDLANYYKAKFSNTNGDE